MDHGPYPHDTQQPGLSPRILVAGITVVALLAILLLQGVTEHPDESRTSRAMLDIRTLESALKLYRLDNGCYPSSTQGLNALAARPDSPPLPDNWKPGGYLDGHPLPRDPWGRGYLYRSPGDAGQDFEIICLGADGRKGGEGSDRDISSHDPGLGSGHKP